MNLKLLGVMLIIVSCGAFGFVLASDLRLEIKSMHDLIGILNFMESELNYRLTPLPQLCRISAKQGGTIKNLLVLFADELDSQISPEAVTCMDAAIRKCDSLSERIKPFLLELGNTFGKFDLQGQLNGIMAVREKCARKLEELENSKELRLRNYQTLGLCAGAALAIILL